MAVHRRYTMHLMALDELESLLVDAGVQADIGGIGKPLAQLRDILILV